ncbi:Uncharacterised protein [Segatella copri]|nr:Uncharacterised protein [Segatella copri]
MDKCCKSCNVSWVEDNNYVLNLWAVLLDVVTKFCSNLAVTLKKILTSHTLLTRSTTRRNNIFSTSESLLWVNSISYVNTWECALLNLIENTMYTWLEDIIKTDVWSKTEHQSALYHVRTDHTACTDDNEFVIC